MTTASESLRSQVEKRIAEREAARQRAVKNKAFARADRYLARKDELEQVLTLIDEKAKELVSLKEKNSNHYFQWYETGLDHALTLLVGQKELGETKAKA